MAAPVKSLLCCAVFLPVLLQAAEDYGATVVAANPIRKVVTMLQAMQRKVEVEGEREQALYDKFMCYCQNSGADLAQGVQSAETRVPQLGSDIEEAHQKKIQTEEDLKSAQVDRSSAKQAMAEATAVRAKEAASYSKASAELKVNIGAMSKAMTAISNGMSGAFLQTDAAQLIKKLALSSQDMLDADREDMVAFFSGGQDEEYVPQGGEIVGILENLRNQMSKSLADCTDTEDSAVKNYNELMTAKKKEVDALSAEIEHKMERAGSLGVEIVQMQNDLTDTEEALIEDKKFLSDLEKDCKTKEAERATVVQMRAQELLALADTIKILNDDDALEMFKKTLADASASFVQVDLNGSLRQRALMEIRQAQKVAVVTRPRVDFIALALQGRKPGFGKVIKMIDEMVQTLIQEQLDDEHKKEYCAAQFDFSEDKKKGLETKLSNLASTLEDASEGITKMKEEIDGLEDGIKALDKLVQEATEQRQAEHEDFNELMASNSAAKELLSFAKNRLNKFYNPKLYKPPPRAELIEDERISMKVGGSLAPGFVQIASHIHKKEEPAPPPQAPGTFKKKSEESSGVIAMIDLLIKDLDKELTEAEVIEKEAQKDYEAMMADSTEKRAADTKALTEKTATKADLQSDLETAGDDKDASTKELMAVEGFISQLHAECDWLLKYFEMRKEARSGEMDSLKKAKAVLSGADFALLQTKFLRRH